MWIIVKKYWEFGMMFLWKLSSKYYLNSDTFAAPCFHGLVNILDTLEKNSSVALGNLVDNLYRVLIISFAAAFWSFDLETDEYRCPLLLLSDCMSVLVELILWLLSYDRPVDLLKAGNKRITMRNITLKCTKNFWTFYL